MNTEKFAGLAAQMMCSALDSWRSGNHLFAVLHSGMSSEFALKAVLCHHDPLLISATGDRALRFHALGFGQEKGVKPLAQARTIGMADAFKDAEVVMQGRMPVTMDAFAPVMEARNGIAHLAHHDPNTAEQVVSTALLVNEAIRRELKIPAADFWGDYAHTYHDLSRISAMASVPRIALEEAAEELAKVEAAQASLTAREALGGVTAAAVSAMERNAAWGNAADVTSRASAALNITHKAIVSAALHTTAMRAQRAAKELLNGYGHRPPAGGAQGAVPARDVVATKALVARQVAGAFIANLPPDLKFTLSSPSGDVTWRPRPYEGAGMGTYLFRFEPCPACPAWGDMYGWLEPDVCADEECHSGGSYCGNHDEGPPTAAHAELFACPVCCFMLDTEHELEAAGMELVTEYDG